MRDRGTHENVVYSSTFIYIDRFVLRTHDDRKKELVREKKRKLRCKVLVSLLQFVILDVVSDKLKERTTPLALYNRALI